MNDRVIHLPSSADEIEAPLPTNPRNWNVQQTLEWFRSLRILTDEQLQAIEEQDVDGDLLALMIRDPLVVLLLFGEKFKLTAGKIGNLSHHLTQLRGMSNTILSFQLLIISYYDVST